MRPLVLAAALALAACETQTPPPPPPKPVEPPAPVVDPAVKAQHDKAVALFQPLPAEPPAGTNELSPARIDLGRMLYYDTRLSKNQDISCNSCHVLDKYGVDGQPTSPGHKGQLGGRNSPTVYHASLHVAQFWDGRAADVEAQAGGPMVNPVEMAMKDGAQVTAVLRSIPGYAPLFQAAFPGAADPVSYENAAIAIGAFERKLMTPAPFDRYLAGEYDALTDAQKKGMDAFIEAGCTACHSGVALGGNMYQKTGVVKPYDSPDLGRYDVTKADADKGFFKVPSLRNIDKTAPYFHDGKVAGLDQAIAMMADIQLGKQLTTEQVADIQAFLGSLTGELPMDTIKMPELPPSGPETPKPDPS